MALHYALYERWHQIAESSLWKTDNNHDEHIFLLDKPCGLVTPSPRPPHTHCRPLLDNCEVLNLPPAPASAAWVEKEEEGAH